MSILLLFYRAFCEVIKKFKQPLDIKNNLERFLEEIKILYLFAKFDGDGLFCREVEPLVIATRQPSTKESLKCAPPTTWGCDCILKIHAWAACAQGEKPKGTNANLRFSAIFGQFEQEAISGPQVEAQSHC